MRQVEECYTGERGHQEDDIEPPVVEGKVHVPQHVRDDNPEEKRVKRIVREMSKLVRARSHVCFSIPAKLPLTQSELTFFPLHTHDHLLFRRYS